MQIKVFEPASLPVRNDDVDDPFLDGVMPADNPERRRDLYLEKMANDERRGMRDLLVANSITVRRLTELHETCPNFSEVIGLVVRAATLAWKGHSEFRLPPLLLVGPPGIGKTFFTRRLAGALGTTVVEQSMTGMDDTALTGHSVSWRGARPGLVARTLIEGKTASPIILVDEFDKPQSVGHADLTDAFHALLEPENARAFVDSYLEVPIRADKISWILTANELPTKHSIRDRLLAIEVKPPNDDERQDIVGNLYATMIRAYGDLFSTELASDAIDALSDEAPRRIKLVIEVALGLAVAARRNAPSADDIRAARAIVGSAHARRPIGF